jgi:lysophospholipase L1-like esterase
LSDRLVGVTRELTTRRMPIGTERYIVLRELDPNTNALFDPTEGYIQQTDNLEARQYRLRVDERGFIYPSRLYENADLDIVFLGGSTTECLYVNEEDRFPYLVGRLLEEDTGLRINSYNAGVSGNTSLHSINVLVNKILPMAPDVAVLMHNINDLQVLLVLQSYWNDNASRGPIQWFDDRRQEPRWYLSLRKLKDILAPHLYVLLRQTVNVGPFLQHDEFADVRGTRITVDQAAMLQAFSRNLQTFIDIARSNAIEPVLVTQASRFADPPDEFIRQTMSQFTNDWGVEYAEYRELYNLFNEQIRTVAGANEVLLIDLAKEIPQDRKYMYDAVHFNDVGSKEAARAIAGALGALGFSN